MAFVMLVAGHAPFVFLHFQHVWTYKPYADSLPMLLALIVWLLWRRFPHADCVAAWSRSAIVLLVADLLLLAGSIIVFSPWLAAVAAVLSCGGVLCYLDGNGPWRRWLPAWALLFLVVTPPGLWEEQLTTQLQELTTHTSSCIMDALKVQHLMEGNVVVIPGKQLFVDEACSGFYSQFTLFAATAIFVVAVRRPLLWSAALLAASIGWSALGNVGRIVTIVVAQSEYGMDLSTGLVHDLFGYGVLCFGLLMLVCTDRLCGFALGPIVPPADELEEWYEDALEDRAAEKQESLSSFSRLWNWCIASQRPPVDETTVDASHASTTNSDVQVRPRSGIGLFFATGALLLGLLQLMCFVGNDAMHAGEPEITIAFPRSTLPTELEGWSLVDYGQEERDAGGDRGRYSDTWTYRGQDLQCQISVDYPFLGWHELTNCYERRGWQVIDQQVGKPHPGAEPWYVEVKMSKPTGEQALVLFSLFDASGRAITTGGSLGMSLAERLGDHPLWNYGPVAATTTIQLQAFVSSEDQLTTAQTESIRQLFLESRERALPEPAAEGATTL